MVWVDVDLDLDVGVGGFEWTEVDAQSPLVSWQ